MLDGLLAGAGGLRVERVEGKGRVLTVARGFAAGEIVLKERPLSAARLDASQPACAAALSLGSGADARYPPLFYWAALCMLTPRELEGCLVDPWPTVTEDAQRAALELHRPDGCSGRPGPEVAALLARLWPPGHGPSAGKVEELLQAWVFNCFDVGGAADEHGGLEAVMLLRGAAMMSHSCEPSAAWSIEGRGVDPCGAAEFVLRARCPINEGEEVTISYLAAGALRLPTPERRKRLQAAKEFWCRCPRCDAWLDDTRGFACPVCGGEAFAKTGAVCCSDGFGTSGSSMPGSGPGGLIIELLDGPVDELADGDCGAVVCVSLGRVAAAFRQRPPRAC